MKLIKSTVKNFRLLSNVEITFDRNTTSIVGKNNTGKTSLSSIFKLFLKEHDYPFHFEDFSLVSHKRFISAFKHYKKINDKSKETRLKRLQKLIPKIQLIFTIEYDEKDNWANIKPFFIDLSEGNRLEILCEYAPSSTEQFLKDLNELMNGITYSDDELIRKIKSLYKNYYKILVRPFSKTERTDNVKRSNLTRLLRAKFINAQRVLDDSDGDSKSKLSHIFQNQFQYENNKDINQSKELIDVIDTASGKIDTELSKFFS